MSNKAINTAIYKSDNPIVPGRKFCAFLVKGQEQLPMVFWATTESEADSKARDWWQTETAKAAAKIERGEKLAQSRGKTK
jgi:hypothetical protein